MVRCVLNTLKRYLVLLNQVALLLCAAAAHASTVNLAPGLEIPLPSALTIEVIEPQDQNHSPMLAGEIGGEPAYFIAATKITLWERDPALWKRLESEIRKQSNTGDFTLKTEGSFAASPHNTVNFKTYEYESADQKHSQIYFLLRDERNLYWLTLTLAEGVDIDVVMPIAQALIRRVSFVDEQTKSIEAEKITPSVF
jgi:hypothetical protein